MPGKLTPGTPSIANGTNSPCQWIRYDIRPNPSRAYAVIGFEGLAPGFSTLKARCFCRTRAHCSIALATES